MEEKRDNYTVVPNNVVTLSSDIPVAHLNQGDAVEINGAVIGVVDNHSLSVCGSTIARYDDTSGMVPVGYRFEIEDLKLEVKQLRDEMERLKRLIIAQQTLFTNGDDGAL